ncbi:hypothetical protein KDD30_09690 [Photobacterium sp. GJ3]|uniref:hypothetical protein n=1 Tax=Photobacterium sp. GJ3 TaxID=2829502 RepID=UPI001B8B1BE2|nr:hypothetical protein [Photobacterium sp. GJ3]QUJ66444.1 hypothetical protein KDD30_09690 [Photobacterium sp. GJ3]
MTEILAVKVALKPEAIKWDQVQIAVALSAIFGDELKPGKNVVDQRFLIKTTE